MEGGESSTPNTQPSSSWSFNVKFVLRLKIYDKLWYWEGLLSCSWNWIFMVDWHLLHPIKMKKSPSMHVLLVTSLNSFYWEFEWNRAPGNVLRCVLIWLPVGPQVESKVTYILCVCIYVHTWVCIVSLTYKRHFFIGFVAISLIFSVTPDMMLLSIKCHRTWMTLFS